MFIQTRGIYETHLSVKDREVSVAFYRDVLELVVARDIPERDVTFFWIDNKHLGMLGIWGQSLPNSTVSGRSHFAFAVDYDFIVQAPKSLLQKGIQPLGLNGEEIQEPIVISWMPAISVYFKDPDGHSLEFIHVLQEDARPELGVISLSEWIDRESCFG